MVRINEDLCHRILVLLNTIVKIHVLHVCYFFLIIIKNNKILIIKININIFYNFIVNIFFFIL